MISGPCGPAMIRSSRMMRVNPAIAAAATTTGHDQVIGLMLRASAPVARLAMGRNIVGKPGNQTHAHCTAENRASNEEKNQRQRRRIRIADSTTEQRRRET